MSNNGTINVCILWQREVKTASALLAQFFAVREDKTKSKDEVGAAAWAALNACHVALLGADTATHVTVCDAERATRSAKKTASGVKKAGGGA